MGRAFPPQQQCVNDTQEKVIARRLIGTGRVRMLTAGDG